jgi:hypothetical protein
MAGPHPHYRSVRSTSPVNFPCIPTCGAPWRTTEPVGPVIRSYRGSHLKANSVVNWFVALFRELVFRE